MQVVIAGVEWKNCTEKIALANNSRLHEVSPQLRWLSLGWVTGKVGKLSTPAQQIWATFRGLNCVFHPIFCLSRSAFAIFTYPLLYDTSERDSPEIRAGQPTVAGGTPR